ncbi:DUF5317 family protein [Streptomyces sp. NPDC059443]|uniref:DUF5317 family protein n=1 Tax=unclassified Streptomyces TaxID=2593676 RepID=UPI00368121E0
MNGQAVLLFGSPVIAGVVAGYVSGGRLTGLVNIRLRALWLVWLAGAAQVAEYAAQRLDGLSGQVVRGVLLAATFGLVLGWLGLNSRGRSRALKAAVSTVVGGALLNGAAIALNGRMPYSPSAAAAAGIPEGLDTAKNVASASSKLPFLADAIPVPALHAVISVGDILITLGAAALIAAAMHEPAPQSTQLAHPEEVT